MKSVLSWQVLLEYTFDISLIFCDECSMLWIDVPGLIKFVSVLLCTMGFSDWPVFCSYSHKIRLRVGKINSSISHSSTRNQVTSKIFQRSAEPSCQYLRWYLIFFVARAVTSGIFVILSSRPLWIHYFLCLLDHDLFGCLNVWYQIRTNWAINIFGVGKCSVNNEILKEDSTSRLWVLL